MGLSLEGPKGFRCVARGSGFRHCPWCTGHERLLGVDTSPDVPGQEGCAQDRCIGKDGCALAGASGG